MSFTDSPYEKMMKQPPHKYPEEVKQPPQGSPCRGCSYWRGVACLGFCYKKLCNPTSGQFVPKLAGGQKHG